MRGAASAVPRVRERMKVDVIDGIREDRIHEPNIEIISFYHISATKLHSKW